MKRAAGNSLLHLYVDKPGGIGLDDLQSVSEEVSAILDAEDPIEGHYTLEVSRPASTARCGPRPTTGGSPRGSSRSCRATSPWTDVVTGPAGSWGARGGVVTLELEKGEGEARVPLVKVSHGRLEVEFPKHG